MKQRLADILRKTGVIHFSDLVRYRISYLRARKTNAAFLKAHTHEPFPEPYMIYETFKMDYERYFESGRLTAQWIAEEVKELVHWQDSTAVLDWGCGPGRVVRHLPSVLPKGTIIHGCDYNEQYVQWCADHLKGITFSKNELRPSLPFKENTFDLAYALSIFTHLSEANHYGWMMEVIKVLKPQGIFLFTTHGDVSKENLLPEEAERYDTGHLVVRAGVKEGHRMYVAYHPTSFVQNLISPFADLVKHIPGERKVWGPQQDTWIIRKR